MADMFNHHNDDLQELLNMLDRMQKRPTPTVGEESADLMDLVQIPAEEPAAIDVFDPEPPMVMLSDLLIHPAEQVEEEEAKPSPSREEEPEEQDLPLPPAPTVSFNPLPALRTLLPARKDDPILRGVKIGTLAIAAVALLTALLLLWEMVALPWHNRRYHHKMADWYHTANASGVTRPYFPEDMRIAFNKLYRANEDVRGWLTFRSNDGGKLVNIDYPVVQTDDNESYRHVDLHGRKSRFGTLFFDKDSRLERDNEGSAWVIYGNTDGSGQMMSALNRLVGNVQQARLATSLTLSNLYEQHEYAVFALLILDDEEPEANRLELRNQFASSEDFLEYVTQLRRRSLFDYPVHVMDKDRLVLLTTDLVGEDYGLGKGRVVLAARRRREGEMVLNMGTIVRNTDAVMPYGWYVKQGLAVPDAYYGKEEMNSAGSTYYDPYDAWTTVFPPTDSTTASTDPWGNPVPTSSDYGATTTQWPPTEWFDNTTVSSTTPPTWTLPMDPTETREGITTTPEEATRTTQDIHAITGPNNTKKDN